MNSREWGYSMRYQSAFVLSLYLNVLRYIQTKTVNHEKNYSEKDDAGDANVFIGMVSERPIGRSEKIKR